MRRKAMAVLGDALLVLQAIATGIGVVLYVGSFNGLVWADGAVFLAFSALALFITGLVTTLRDRRFFLNQWGFGITGPRREFPFQWFPARKPTWLNPLGWVFSGLVLIHFAVMVLSAQSRATHVRDEAWDLRYCSLMVVVGGSLSVLQWVFPPTLVPADYE